MEPIIITTPEGEEIKIDGTRVCYLSSLEVCWEERPEMIELLISHAWHHGWPRRRA